MQDRLRLLVKALGEERVKRKESLYYHTFSKSEGLAEGFYIATNPRELIKALDLCLELQIPYLIVGSGTKVYISKKGFNGLVIKNRTSTIKTLGVKGKVGKSGIGLEEAIIEADSGISLRKLGEYLEEQNLEKIDGFSSLNSTVGGALFLDPVLRGKALRVRVWEQSNVLEIDIWDLKMRQAVISVSFKFKARD